MALTLSTSGITNSGTIEAAHVSQSIDALKGTHAYNLTPSGSFTFTGDTTFAGTISGNASKILTSTVTETAKTELTFEASNCTYQLVVEAAANSGTNLIGFTLPEASSVPGTMYKLLIGQIGANAISPSALARPLTITTGGNQNLLGSILTVAATPLQRSSGPFISMSIPAGKSKTGDQYNCISDGTYWYVTGFSGTNSVTYAS